MIEFGLTDSVVKIIRQVFADDKRVKKVYIFGSRANGSYRKTSDIDLAVKFASGGKSDLAKLRFEMEELPVIYKIDLIDVDEQSAGSFKSEFEKTKKLFYSAGL